MVGDAMTLAASLSRSDDDLAQRIAAAVVSHFHDLRLTRVIARLDLDWSGDEAVYFRLVTDRAPTSAQLAPVRDYVQQRVHAEGLQRIPYVSVVLASELDEHDRAL